MGFYLNKKDYFERRHKLCEKCQLQVAFNFGF